MGGMGTRLILYGALAVSPILMSPILRRYSPNTTASQTRSWTSSSTTTSSTGWGRTAATTTGRSRWRGRVMAKHIFGGDWTSDKLERVRKYLCACEGSEEANE